MKVRSLFLALVVSVAAANEAEVGADGTINDAPCDCATEVAEAVSAVAREKEGLLAELNASREQANAKIAEVDNLVGQLNSARQQLAATEQAVEEARRSTEEAKSAASRDNESARASITSLEEKVAAAEKEAGESKKEADALKSSWVLVNANLIKSDVKGFLKGFGIEL